ncbi:MULTISPECIES: tRNA pseudouridine(38-40) synthase TruA [Asaia]|uniref:tRNA pseudouridine(38-40) synthase TruA n=1 Tax=Asaia TaxID=91914 RepID=UPI0025565309|nr:tRNA pseudouridine(38-40) synthase TruA [Asaia sp. HumB]MDL2170115.1 tRNA pseudouridine(38-40) synthase TruA [Asaia sp. HumB]
MGSDEPAGGYRRWALRIEYDGTGLVGWQRQNNGVSVQALLEEAASRLVGDAPVMTATAGRTDAGVHASSMVVQLDLPDDPRLDARQIRDGVSFHLKPHRVAILETAQARPGWHARFSAISRRYCYTILNRPTRPVIDLNHVWHIRRPLDAGAMHEAAQSLLGRHDFSSFRAASCQASSPIRTLDRLDVTREGTFVRLDVEARSFLHHQVRNLAGSLQLVGSGQWPVARIRDVLESCDRRVAGPTAPPDGLCLIGVGYELDPFT